MKFYLLPVLILTTLLLCHRSVAQNIVTIAGTGATGNNGDNGPAINAAFNFPNSVHADTQGNLYVISNNVLRRITLASGIITYIAGDGVSYQSGTFANGDGGLATNARFGWMRRVITDTAGNIYIADYEANNVRRIDINTGTITTIAGNGVNGYSGDGGPAVSAAIGGITSITFDAVGNLYIANTHSNRVRRVSATTGVISTFAGTGAASFSGDNGPAVNAAITSPLEIYADAAGNVFVAEITSGITCRVRKINIASGVITTIAGNVVQAFSGDGGLAINAGLHDPAGIAADQCGNVFISTISDSRIRRVDAATGIISTIAGNGSNGFAGDGAAAVNSVLNRPHGISIDANGTLYFADNQNNRIRKIIPATTTLSITASANPVCPGQPIMFTAFAVNPTITPFYQWKKNGVPAGSNSVTFVTNNLADNDVFECSIAGSTCSGTSVVTSNKIVVRVTNVSPPVLTYTVSPVANCGEDIITLTAAAQGASNPVFNWKRNGNNLGTGGAVFSGQFSIGDSVTCVMTGTDACGITRTLTAGPVTLRGRTDLAPEVSIAASATAVCAGSPVTFTATNVSGSAPVTYTWLVNGNRVSETSPIFTTTTLTNGAKVECMMTVPQCQQGGSTKDYSNPIIITLLSPTPPAIAIAASKTTICKGSNIIFTATVTPGITDPVYQWKVNGNDVGTNTPAFSAGNLNNGDVVLCRLKTAASTCAGSGDAVSNTIMLRVVPGTVPSVTISPSATTVCSGTNVLFTAAISGSLASPVYQWMLNGNVTGSNNSTYATTSLASGDKVSVVLLGDSNLCQQQVSSAIVVMGILGLPIINFNPPSILLPAGQQATWQANVTGSIASFLYTPASKLVNAAVFNATTTPLTENTTYTLRVQDVNGCAAQKQMMVQVYRDLAMPTAFTPNNDGVNDVFRIPAGVNINLQAFSIYDRWGNKIFTTSNLKKGWDGKLKGMECGSGTYAYTITGTKDNQPVQLNGTVVLLR